jgi:hypothetical protein
MGDDLRCKFKQIVDACMGNDQARIAEEALGLAKVSTNHLLAAFEFRYRQIDREGPSQLLICVGTELLLNALAILLTPEQYAQACGKKVKPPGFERVKNCVKRRLSESFSVRQKHRLQDILDLIQDKRNIFAHLSLGIHARYYQHYEMLNVLHHLLQTYFPQLDTEILYLQAMKEKFRMKGEIGHDYIDFTAIELCQQGDPPDACGTGIFIDHPRRRE